MAWVCLLYGITLLKSWMGLTCSRKTSHIIMGLSCWWSCPHRVKPYCKTRNSACKEVKPLTIAKGFCIFWENTPYYTQSHYDIAALIKPFKQHHARRPEPWSQAGYSTQGFQERRVPHTWPSRTNIPRAGRLTEKESDKRPWKQRCKHSYGDVAVVRVNRGQGQPSLSASRQWLRPNYKPFKQTSQMEKQARGAWEKTLTPVSGRPHWAALK